jgi:hypothetical protein
MQDGGRRTGGRQSRRRSRGGSFSGVAPALASGALPIFIEWDAAPGFHPGAAVAEHAIVLR